MSLALSIPYEVSIIEACDYKGGFPLMDTTVLALILVLIYVIITAIKDRK